VAFVTISGLTVTVTSILGVEAVLNGEATAAGQVVNMNANGTDFSLVSTLLDDSGFIVFQFGDDLIMFSNTTLSEAQEVTFTEGNFGDYVVPCFVLGTRILTRRGEVAVEDLRVGDKAMAMLGGGFSTITWIGHRRVVCSLAKRPTEQWPLRVRAGAFGVGKPHTDLLLSPDHAVHVNGSLIPIRYLENGTTVVRAPMDEVTYYHVELEQHDLLVAEGLPAESYLDTGNRADFTGVSRDAALADQDERNARQVWASRSCLPLQVSGPVVSEARAMLARRAVELEFDDIMEPEIRLQVGDREIHPTRIGESWHFELPEQTAGVKLVSACHIPAVTAPGSTDRRCLGIPVTRMMIDGRHVPNDAPFLQNGWHAPEDGFRWTTGMAQLPPLRMLTLLVAPIMPSSVYEADTSTEAAA
jgi:hypothetical protein